MASAYGASLGISTWLCIVVDLQQERLLPILTVMEVQIIPWPAKKSLRFEEGSGSSKVTDEVTQKGPGELVAPCAEASCL